MRSRALHVAVAAVPALVVAQGWLRLEAPRRDAERAALLVLLGLAPALAPRLRQRLALLAVAACAAAAVAVRVSPLDARPRNEERDFFGPLASRLWNGLLDFYDVKLPLDPFFQPRMHAWLLVACFAFAAGLGLAAAARRPLLAVSILVVGAGWPATLYTDGRDLARGAVILACALFVLAAFRSDARRTLGRAALAAAALVAVALAASTQPAVAKSAFLAWKSWDLYTRPDRAVGVDYVWDASYDGFRFPEKETVVLEVKAAERSVYWRATTLDVYSGARWIEDLRPAEAVLFDGKRELAGADPLAPAAAFDRGRWRRAEVEIAAFRDDHLVAPSVPVAYDTRVPNVSYTDGGTAIVAGWLRRGMRYDVWSYSPAPGAAALARSRPVYPAETARFREVVTGIAAPAFGRPRREAELRALFALHPEYFSVHGRLYAAARRVVGDAASPYGAAVALETWFRRTGGFRYDQQPPRAAGELPPLVHFVTRSKRGYCQHFAGAMALMLRYLGIPARVAEGFTSGVYDDESETWTVTDHDAHAWVEVWFDGYGWLPFDPTPGRGSLSASYSASSPDFDPTAAALLVAGAAAELLDQFDLKLAGEFGDRGVAPPGRAAADPRRGGGGAPSAGEARRGGSLAKLVALAFLVMLAIVALAKTAVRRARYATHDPRRLASACRGELVDFLADQGVHVPPSVAPEELAHRLRDGLAVDASGFARALAAARYGPEADAYAAAERARIELRDLQRQLRASLGVPRRARGLLSLRSLGFAS